MTEPCACPPAEPSRYANPDVDEIARHFDERTRDWQPIGPEATDMLFGWLQEAGLAGSSLLDVGCGTGEFIVRALEAGVTRATGADLSSEAIAQASELANEEGVSDRVDLWVGDAAVEPLDQHDVVVLDKVICCYPDADALISCSTAAAGKLYGFSVPESQGLWGFIARVRWMFFDLLERLEGGAQPRFVHDRTDVEAQVLAAGFRPVRTGRQFVWFVGVYARR